ncbi:endoribonuclease ZC3H12A [Menidia menidia]
MTPDVNVSPAVQPWTQLRASQRRPPAWDPPPRVGPPPCEEMQAQLDFFQKLGYSRAQVQAVQQQLGSTDTDKLLGELVRTGAARGARQGPVTTMTVLVPPGGAQAGTGPPSLLPPSDLPPAGREETGEDADALRAVVIDGSNVAMSHGNKEFFSCLGIQLAVSFFLDRGHRDVTVFVPSWRKEQPRPDVPITDQQILRDLEKKKVLVFTPSRRVAGRRVVCNDDAFIVKHAFESDGVIVSNDMYRDLQAEKPEWRRFIQERLLMFSFVNNKFMPPDDPLGRYGPNLDNFLRRFPKTGRKQPCPYGKKCTYGSKCRFHHPERVKQMHRGAPLDELRPGATRTASSSPAPGGPVSNGLALVEDMARKLSLAPDSGSGKHQDQAVQGKGGGHRTGRKAPRRDRPPPATGRWPPPQHRG